jgi:hypothetical protein
VEGKQQRRAATHEATIRVVNEGIERGQWPGDEDAPVGFRCECASPVCNRLVELSVREYEAVRSHPRRFVVLPGHERPEVEAVVATRPGYVIVEKRDQPGVVAGQTNPRD